MKRWIAFWLALCCAFGRGLAEGEWVQAAVVNCEEWVSLRLEPNTASERMIEVPLGAAVIARPYDDHFAECSYIGLHGYILLDYLTLPRPEPEVAAASGTLVPNVDEFLSLRSSPGGSAPVIERVLPGVPMKLLGWSGDFAHVRVAGSGSTGYVHTGYVRDAMGDLSRWPYDYDYMMADLSALGLETEIIGHSLDGRAIPAVRFGSGDTHILIQADIHGRELMSGRLAMDLLAQLVKDHPGGIDGMTFHVMPMVNPDGVTIAVHGSQEIGDSVLRAQVDAILAREGVSHDRWKANARGADLNRNYATGWESLTGRTPGSERYRGEFPLSEPESKALADYFLRYDFAATVSYHSYGSVIYWQGAVGEVAAVNETLAQVVADCTGYPLERNELATVERGGFKDWALMDCGVPSITVEIGALDSTGSIFEYTGILMRHSGSWEKIADWALNR